MAALAAEVAGVIALSNFYSYNSAPTSRRVGACRSRREGNHRLPMVCTRLRQVAAADVRCPCVTCTACSGSRGVLEGWSTADVVRLVG
jgi:hypothetical protein